MSFVQMPFKCIASGSTHQGDAVRFPGGRNSQCVAMSTCAIAFSVNIRRSLMTTEEIDQILTDGNRLYHETRNVRQISHFLLEPDEILTEFILFHCRVSISPPDWILNGLYPRSIEALPTSVATLQQQLSSMFSVATQRDGFLFTGQNYTVSFWKFEGGFFLFNSHGVSEKGVHDSVNDSSNSARLFHSKVLKHLSELLFVNAACDGIYREYSVYKVTVGLLDHHIQSPAPMNITNASAFCESNVGKEVTSSPSAASDSSLTLATLAKRLNTSTQPLMKRGRPRKVKRGRKKSNDKPRKEQIRDAMNKYVKDKPEPHRKASKRYTKAHPNVHRNSVLLYNDTHPDVNKKSVERYKISNKNHLTTFRTIPAPLRQRGLIGEYSSENLSLIQPHHLKIKSLQSVDAYRCRYCSAPLFEEEKGRKKWCCGEGAYIVSDLPLTNPKFYECASFKEHPRAYNNLFAFSALGVSHGFQNPKSGVSFLKIQGRTYHRVFDLSYKKTMNPCGLYIDDGSERRRLAEGMGLDLFIIKDISDHLHNVNPFIGHLKQLSLEPSDEAHLKFEYTTRKTHGKVLGDMPRSTEIAAVLSTDRERFVPRTIVIWKIGGSKPHTVDLFHPCYEAFQYPLLYPHGTPGWHIGLKDLNQKKCSQVKYYRWIVLSHPRFYGCGRLSEEWIVDMYCRVEEERLRFYKNTQSSNREGGLRVASVNELEQAGPNNQFSNDETIQGESKVVPGKIYLPNTFTGGPRYMKTRYMDGMAIVNRLGKPSYFLTITCNPKWPEIVHSISEGRFVATLLSARVFQLKLLELLRDLRSGAFFGAQVYILYVIEFQKRGLPHAHICFRVDGGGPVESIDIDKVVRADIPSSEDAGGRLRNLVLTHMIHGPCGVGLGHRTTLPCWDAQQKKCMKYFPKPAKEVTHIDDRGFVHLKRDENNKGSVTYRCQQVEVDDRWVVPYNAALLLKYDCHINLEVAATRNIVKYLFKYILKGPDEARVAISSEEEKDDEVEQYVTKRYIGSCDAAWRILEFDVTGRDPNVEHLPVHLEGRQTVVFRAGEEGEAVQRSTSKLLIYFTRPQLPEFELISYAEFYEQYIVHSSRPRDVVGNVIPHPDGKHFITKRKRGKTVARLFWVGPQRGEQFYLRVLLNKFPSRGYAHLIGLGGKGCTTFQEAARAMGLVNDDNEYDSVLDEAAQFMTGFALRRLFVLLLVIGAPGAILWAKQKQSICEDLLQRVTYSEDRAYTQALILIDRQLRRHGSCLSDHGLPNITDDSTELKRELLLYNTEKEAAFVNEWAPRLSAEQKTIFDYVKMITDDETLDCSKSLFIDGPSGSGKTLLLNIIASSVRAQRKIALCTASSGIAALNHVNGITAHSMFRLPLDLTDDNCTWGLTNTSQRGQLIRESTLIIYDEAPMTHKFLIHILDRSLRDLTGQNKPFGGKTIIFAGDFRQIPPVVVGNKSASDITEVSLRSSHIWESIEIFHLTEAQRTRGDNDYTDFLLRLGNGLIPFVELGNKSDKQRLIGIPQVKFVTDIKELIDFIFPHDVICHPDSCAKRALLCVNNRNIVEINETIIQKLFGETVNLYSADFVCKEDADNFLIGPDTLHNIHVSGIPDHVLKLKIGVVCMIMRNLSFTDRLVNGAKVIVTAISPHLVTVRKPGDGECFSIPRIIFKTQIHRNSPLEMCRRQFPLQVAYAMSIHKSQGQTIDVAGVDLRSDPFSHGQLYVALGRVRSAENIRILVNSERVVNGIPYVKNVVYPELL